MGGMQRGQRREYEQQGGDEDEALLHVCTADSPTGNGGSPRQGFSAVCE